MKENNNDENETVKITLPEKKCDPMEESAAQFYAMYGNRSKAYRHGYNVVDMLPQSVWSKASVLFKRPHVKARVGELRLELEAENLTTRREQLEILINIRDYNMPQEPKFAWSEFEPDQAIALKAVALINQMLGWDAAIKVETKKEVTVDFKTSAEFKAALEAIQKQDDC